MHLNVAPSGGGHSVIGLATPSVFSLATKNAQPRLSVSLVFFQRRCLDGNGCCLDFLGRTFGFRVIP